MFLGSTPVVDVQTDACFEGLAAFFARNWVYSHFSFGLPQLSDLHITQKETLAIVMAAEHWALAWAIKHVIIRCDNQAVVSVINKGTTPNVILVPYLHWLFWLSAVFNFRITAHYVPGCCNFIADAMSRLHDQDFLLIVFTCLCIFFLFLIPQHSYY